MMNFIDLRSRLASGEFDFLIGLVEDEHFDAKSGKYDLIGESGKLELAKDVSSFANRSGGIIVIGAKTTDDPAFYGRRIDSVSLFPFNLINPTDYHNIIKDWIYPRPENVDVDWIPSKDESDKGLVYIFVPDQPENLRPFLLKKDVDPSTNRRRKEILFGYAERVSHSSDPVTVEAFHLMVRHGRENRWKEDIGSRLAAIEARLSESPEEKERKKNLEQIVLPRVGRSVEAAGLKEHRTYSLVVSPVDSTEVESILSSTPDSIASLLEQPPPLRYAGWGMETGDRAKLIGGEIRRVKADEYKVLDLYRDGTLVFACRADEALLGWGNRFGKTRINPVALIETTYMFFKFYELVLARLEPVINEARVWVLFHNLHSGGEITSLAPHGVDSTSQITDFYKRDAPENDYVGRVRIEIQNFDASRTAVLILREIYGWFGIESDKIPYLTTDKAAIDVERIKKLSL
ncbi:MAG: hypothetical protein HY961_22255 [Ignavibacteriae bacterium]|nr:hypothetical protein [Ignavibacteriota bacterium]